MNILPLNVKKPLVGTPVEVVGDLEEDRVISGGTEKLNSPKLYVREA